MEPVRVDTRPAEKYRLANLDYGMTIGIEQTPGGRIWCCWVAGGDDADAYFLLAWSDDRGETWSDTKAVIDPHDATLPEKRRTIVGNLWCDPDGRLWLFYDVAMTYYDGREAHGLRSAGILTGGNLGGASRSTSASVLR